MFTVGEILRNRAGYSPHLEAVISLESRYTYREFNRRVNQLVHFMLELGVQKGDRIAILCSTNIPFAIIFFAAAKLGAISVPLNWRFNSVELRSIMEHSKPKILFYEDDFAAAAEELEPLEFLERMVRAGVEQKINPPFEEALLERPDAEPEVEVDSSDPVILTYTSGTTGAPKGVITTHYNLFSSAMAASITLGIRKGDRFLATTPLFHISGVSFISLAPLAGATTVFMPKFHPVHIWELVEKERITQTITLPPMLDYMLEPLMEGDWDHGSFREIYCGGAGVSQQLINQYDSLGFPVVQVYSASEFSGAITFWTPDMGKDSSSSVGKNVLGEIKLIDPETGQETPTGEVGEVLCKGPQVSPKYWNDPEETARALKDGWFYTGDAGRMDENGFLYIVDRYVDVVHCGDEKIFPTQVEAVLLELEDVQEVAVIGVPDEERGEAPRAYVVKKEGSNLTEEDVIKHARRRLAAHKLKDVIMTDHLPKNTLGNVLKYILREQAKQSETVSENGTG